MHRVNEGLRPHDNTYVFEKKGSPSDVAMYISVGKSCTVGGGSIDESTLAVCLFHQAIIFGSCVGRRARRAFMSLIAAIVLGWLWIV
jgi:hypothetical protein